VAESASHDPQPFDDPDAALVPSPTGLAGGELWSKTLAELQARKPLQAGFAGQGIFLDQRGTEMVIGFAPSSQMAKDSLNRPAAKAAVEEILSALTGEAITLKLETHADLSPPPPPPKPEPPPRPTPTPKAEAPAGRNGKSAAAAAPPPEPPPAEPDIPFVAEEEFYNDPLIAAALSEFQATIASITPARKAAP
jgi:hypothetical protein